jgi:glycerol-3-phosphate dehydrogenase
MPYPVRFVILGGGNFGLALSHVLARNGIPTTLLLRKQSIADHINEVSAAFFPCVLRALHYIVLAVQQYAKAFECVVFCSCVPACC